MCGGTTTAAATADEARQQSREVLEPSRAPCPKPPRPPPQRRRRGSPAMPSSVSRPAAPRAHPPPSSPPSSPLSSLPLPRPCPSGRARRQRPATLLRRRSRELRGAPRAAPGGPREGGCRRLCLLPSPKAVVEESCHEADNDEIGAVKPPKEHAMVTAHQFGWLVFQVCAMWILLEHF
jgi:hypothetical protein